MTHRDARHLKVPAVHLGVPAGKGHLAVRMEDPEGVEELVSLNLNSLRLPILLVEMSIFKCWLNLKITRLRLFGR